MNSLFLLGVCITIHLISNAVAYNCTLSKEIDEEWKLFKTNYLKRYATANEETLRRNTFEYNYCVIKNHNEKYRKNEVNFSMGMNKFGDLNHSEFLNLFSTKDDSCTEAFVDDVNDVHDFDYDDRNKNRIPENWDWSIQKKCADEVKDQENCKSGWAYSGIDAIDMRRKINTNSKTCICHLSPSSVNYVKDCHPYNNCGCEGGSSYNLCEFLKINNKVPNEKSYNERKTCQLNNISSENSNIFNIKKCQTAFWSDKNSKLIRTTIFEKGPVASTIYAAQPSFQFAREGIYDDINCNGSLNHEVSIVGYGIKADHKYWIIKNSFGVSWGDKGYLRVSHRKKNKCRILAGRISYPELHM